MDEKLDKFIAEQTSALKLLYEVQLLTPFLTILYTTVDILGHISGKGFEGFISKYMLKSLKNVSSSDLWGARHKEDIYVIEQQRKNETALAQEELLRRSRLYYGVVVTRFSPDFPGLEDVLLIQTENLSTCEQEISKHTQFTYEDVSGKCIKGDEGKFYNYFIRKKTGTPYVYWKMENMPPRVSFLQFQNDTIRKEYVQKGIFLELYKPKGKTTRALFDKKGKTGSIYEVDLDGNVSEF